MQTRRIRTLHFIIILLSLVTMIALTFTGVVGVLYIKERSEVKRLMAKYGEYGTDGAISVGSFQDLAQGAEVDGQSSGENGQGAEGQGDGSGGDESGAGQGVNGSESNGTGENDGQEVDGQVTDGNSSGVDASIIGGDSSEVGTDGQGNVSDENGQEVTPTGGNAVAVLPEDGNAVEESMKQRMKELVIGEDGSPLKMLRSFFPENLIYYDEQQYVFSPVLDEVKKHNLIAENFVENDRGEMEYVENGVVTSHKGIDVSKYQGEIDWQAVKADGVEYAFIRLGLRCYESGKIVLDEYFEQNLQGANDADVKAGVYFFTQAVTEAEAREEANFVLENIAGYQVSYPIVFDVEMITNANGRANALSKEERTNIAIAFCETIRQAGYTPMIYGNVKCFTKLLDMTRLQDYEKWYAFYDNYMYMPYEVSCWQYTEKGKVNGIKEEVDMNISYKTW